MTSKTRLILDNPNTRLNSTASEKSIQAQHMLEHTPSVRKIGPGEQYVTRTPGELVVTVLGSCVSACVRDPIAGVGGMNHFMLPESDDGIWGKARSSLRFGNFAMEQLVNDILTQGGRRERLIVKVMGGGNVLDNCVDVGARNSEFVEAYLQAEGLKIASKDLRGNYARRVHFMPVEGRLWMKKLHRHAVTDLRHEETAYSSKLKVSDVGGTVELF